MTSLEEQPLLEVRNAHIRYGNHSSNSKHAVKGVSFEVRENESLALVGESGSGKSSLAKAIVRLVPLYSGEVVYRGRAIQSLPRKDFLPYRRKIQLIFQDPWNSLNPRATVEEILAEPFRIHFPKLNRSDRRARSLEMLDQVGLPRSSLERLPAAFSGGQRQRIVIARALAVDPEILICDEAVSALDVSIQARILDLLRTLRKERQLSLLFISHDLAVVYAISDRVIVLREGTVREVAPTRQLFTQPEDSYTRTLLTACPRL